MTFKDPWILIVGFILLVLVCFFYRKRNSASFRFSSVGLLSGLKQNWKVRLNPYLFVLRVCILMLFFLALAGPRKILKETEYKTEGIDIVLAIDASGSMAAEDFKINGKRQNRLAVVKNVVKDFAKGRTNDRLGLVVFAAEAFTACPLTTDYDWLVANMERIELGMIRDGTAVGSAIVSSLSRLENSKAKSKIVILLTDGVNNAGKIDPITAAEIAQSLKIKVYTIGAGTKGLVPFPLKDFFGRTVYKRVKTDLDEDTLFEIARLTNAKYFRATDTKSLAKIYEEIDALEKTEIEKTGYKEYKELFVPFLCAALGLLVAEIMLTNTLFLKVP